MSYVIVPAAKAKDLATESLEFVKRQRARDIQTFIDGRVKLVNNHWYRKLFKMKAVTPAQVEAEDRQREGLYSSIENIEIFSYARTEDVAYQILRASKVGDPIHIDTDDLRYL